MTETLKLLLKPSSRIVATNVTIGKLNVSSYTIHVGGVLQGELPKEHFDKFEKLGWLDNVTPAQSPLKLYSLSPIGRQYVEAVLAVKV